MAARSPVVLRDAGLADAAALIELWEDGVAAGLDADAGQQQSLWRRPTVDEASLTLTEHQSRSGSRVIVALVDDEIVGATVCQITTLTPITPTRVLVVTDLQVSTRHRRRGVAWALLSAVADHGDDHDCEVVLACIPAQAREPHRYLTKVGFSQVAVLRAIQASKLRSRLTARSTHSRETGRMIAVRRTLRRRQGARPTA
ncbi:acetyltransferase, GNAT family [Aeromicrobium marinum DSM 15272]|uniref:Acetyltransferase, GNAT family n=1 Tax=Aeromicrobium marinum DSM 15272 TaxID=585531 RepID=E2S993_9ACTN|nr:GNAT family N-acetyltransferase [Aeromicrobium marinum]EFQ83817.1 acetyltransferase, GNAT family [Aeromicrobium marinum DSM 15272]